MPSVMRSQHNFSTVPRAEIPRSQFDRSHSLKTALYAGYIIPIFVDEALPGDTLNLRMNGFARLATPLKPIMDNLYIDTFFFAVPNRLVWQNWQKFCGEQIQPGDSTSFVIPQQTVPVAGYVLGSVQDYFGLPTGVPRGATPWSHSALWTRAYYAIYNAWFRDENLQPSLNEVGAVGVVSVGDGPDVAPVGGCPLVKRGKRHDYFTSCLPFPQKGTAVTIPLGTSAPVVSSGAAFNFRGLTSGLTDIPRPTVPGPVAPIGFSTGPWTVGEALAFGGSGLQTDLSMASAATIFSLRQAFQIQKLLERDARGGTRYVEIVKSHFGVTSPDARLQRPEYLGGGSAPILVSPIAQNSSTDVTSPQGNLAGIGTGSWSGHGFVKSFTEHTLILGFAVVRSELTYQQGVDRMFSRSTRYDFYWPALAHIGEQAVLNKEIYVQGTAADSQVFGYNERYSEYRFKLSRITNVFRSTAPTSLDIWHLSQEFSALPVLNSTFIVEDPPLARIMAVPSEPHVILDAWFNYKCARPMPMFSVPGLIDHF